MATWRFVLTDLSCRPVGEILNATARKVANPLSKLDTASLQVRLDNPLADRLMSLEGYIKGYRGDDLRFFGPLISAEESVDSSSASIAVNAVGGAWGFSKCLVGRSATGAQFTTLTDRAVIAKQLISDFYVAAQALQNVPHVGVGVLPSFSASAITYTAGPYRPLSECITELGQSFDGFDWRVMPTENWINGALTNKIIGQWWAQDVIGSDLSQSVFFEYGTGRSNVQSYKRTLSREQQANSVYHITNNGPDAPGFPVVSALDSTSISDWGLLEDLAQADLLDATMRTQLVQEHVRVRKDPRQVVEFVPVQQLSGSSSRLPQPGVDYDIGDFVTGRAAYDDKPRFNGVFRVYGLAFDIDDLNNEATTITLVDDGGS